MKKVVFVVLVLFAGFMLYYFIGSSRKEFIMNDRPVPVENTTKKVMRTDDNLQHKYSMKQIDSITANLNYKFTVDNKIPDSISKAPVEKKKQVQKPAGK